MVWPDEDRRKVSGVGVRDRRETIFEALRDSYESHPDIRALGAPGMVEIYRPLALQR